MSAAAVTTVALTRPPDVRSPHPSRLAAWLACLALAACARALPAQCTANTTTCRVVTLAGSSAMTVPKLTSLSLGTGSLTLAATRLSAAQYAAGMVDGGALVVTARANAPWSVTFAPTTATFAYAGTLTNPNKPASQLQWARGASCPAPAASYAATALGGNAVFAAGTGAATPAAGVSQQLCFRTALGWTADVPGTYTLQLTVTMTAP